MRRKSFHLLGHDNPTGRYPAPVAPIGKRGSLLQAAYLEDDGVQFFPVEKDAPFVRHSLETSRDLSIFDVKAHRLFAIDEQRILFFEADNEPTFLRWILSTTELQNASPFTRLSLAKESKDVQFISGALLACGESMKDNKKLLHKWYKKELDNLRKLPIWHHSELSHLPLSWESLESFHRETAPPHPLISTPITESASTGAGSFGTKPYEDLTRQSKDKTVSAATNRAWKKLSNHFFYTSPIPASQFPEVGDSRGAGFSESYDHTTNLLDRASSQRFSGALWKFWLNTSSSPMVVLGDTGSGKSTMINYLARQYREKGHPIIYLDWRENRRHEDLPEITLAHELSSKCLDFIGSNSTLSEHKFLTWLDNCHRSPDPLQERLFQFLDRPELFDRLIHKEVKATSLRPALAEILGPYEEATLLLAYISQSANRPLSIVIDNLDSISPAHEAMKGSLGLAQHLSEFAKARCLLTSRTSTLKNPEHWWKHHGVRFVYYKPEDPVSKTLARRLIAIAERPGRSLISATDPQKDADAALSDWMRGFCKSHLQSPSAVASVMDTVAGDNIRLALSLLQATIKSLPMPQKQASEGGNNYGRTEEVASELLFQSVRSGRIINAFSPRAPKGESVDHEAYLGPLRILRHLATRKSGEMPIMEARDILRDYGFSQNSAEFVLDSFARDPEGLLITSPEGASLDGVASTSPSTLVAGDRLHAFLSSIVCEPIYVAACAGYGAKKRPSGLQAAVTLLEDILDHDAEQAYRLIRSRGPRSYRRVLGSRLETHAIAERILWSLLTWETKVKKERLHLLERLEKMILKAKVLEKDIGLAA